MSGKKKNSDWQCGGWKGARRETIRHMMSLSFEEKIQWLEEAQDLIAEMHGEEAALLSSGSIIPPKKDAPR